MKIGTLETRTTDLTKVKAGARFTWGQVENIHTIGRYDFVEYRPEPDHEPLFHVYVDGKTTSCSERTLEKALVLAIAKAHNEINTARFMAEAAARVLNLKDS